MILLVMVFMQANALAQPPPQSVVNPGSESALVLQLLPEQLKIYFEPNPCLGNECLKDCKSCCYGINDPTTPVTEKLKEKIELFAKTHSPDSPVYVKVGATSGLELSEKPKSQNRMTSLKSAAAILEESPKVACIKQCIETKQSSKCAEGKEE